MDSAVRSSSSLSPAATGRQGSASDGAGSMWAAVLLGVLTAFFAWLWFSSSGDDGDGTDSPKSQLQPVREEEEEETCAKSESSSAPLTQDTPREGEEPHTAPLARESSPESEQPRTAPPAREPSPESEQPRTAPLTLETPRESERSAPGSPDGGSTPEHSVSPALKAEHGDGGAVGQEPGHPNTHRTKLESEERKLKGDTAHPILHSKQSERSHLHQQDNGVDSLQEPSTASTLQAQRISDEGAEQETRAAFTQDSNQESKTIKPQEPSAALNLETKQESKECPLPECRAPLNVEPQQQHESAQEETKANITLAGEDLILQASEAPLTLESEVIKSLGSKPLQSSQDCEESKVLEPRASLIQASIQEAEEINQLETLLPVLESEESKAKESLDGILEGEDHILKDSEAPLTPQDGILQEPETPLPPQSSKESLHGILAGEDHILLGPEAPLILESDVIKLLESKAPAPLQSGQDCEESMELEPRVSLIQASKQEAEEINQLETTPLPVLESEESTAMEATDSHAFASKNGNEELKLQEFHSPQTQESQQDEKGKLQESWNPLPSTQTFKNENEESSLQESTAPLSLEFNEEGPDNIQSKVPLKPQSSKNSQDAILKPEAPLKLQSSKEVQDGLLLQPEALLTPQFNKESEHGILQEPETPLTLQSSEESQDDLLQEPKALDSKQDNQENTVQDVSFPESKQERRADPILEDKPVKTLEPKQKIEGLEQLEVKAPEAVESQHDNEEAKQSIAPPTLVSKQEKEGLGEQETRSPLTAYQKDDDFTLQVNQAPLTLVSQQDGEVVNLKEFKGLPTPESQVSEEGKAQEPTAPLSLVSLLEKEEEIKVQEPRLLATLGSQQDGEETKLQESGAPISSLLPKQEHDQGILQVPSPPLNLEPTEDAQQSKPLVIGTALTLESQQGNEDPRHLEAEVPQTVDKEGPYLTHYVLEEEEQCNKQEMHPRGIPAECSIRGNEMFLVEEHYKPESVEEESPDEKQECDSDTLFQNEHPESKKALWSSSPITLEKLGSDLNEVGEEMKGDATVGFPLVNGHRSLMDQCVASIAADHGGDILAKENKSAEMSTKLTNVQVLEINVNERKEVLTNPMLFNQTEDLCDLKKLNINYESSVPELANVSETDFKPTEGEHTREKKVAAIQPMPQLVNVVFTVHYIPHKDSQLLAVIGDHEGLGGWEDYILMTYDKNGFWTHSVLLPSDTNMEWKFVMVEDGKIKRWEECANRSLKTGHDDINAHKLWGYH